MPMITTLCAKSIGVTGKLGNGNKAGKGPHIFSHNFQGHFNFQFEIPLRVKLD